MRKSPRLLPVLLSALAVTAAVPAAAGASAPRAAAAIHTTQARFGGFRGTRAPSYGSRYRSRYPRGYRRPSPFHGLGGSILKGLGIAYLFHALFGWGAGGSPFGLLLLLALIAFVATRRRRRRLYY